MVKLTNKEKAKLDALYGESRTYIQLENNELLMLDKLGRIKGIRKLKKR